MAAQLHATNMFIFGGSASIGVERAGFKLDRVLELCDDMNELNGVHWVHNRPDVPMIPPSEWETVDYLRSATLSGVDYVMGNCPCSGLSRINRNASADSASNVHFYRLFDAFATFKPKTFSIENAPTLTTTGYKIIKDFVDRLSPDYNFTILSDMAGAHGVAMNRARTMLVGWRRDVFEDKIPLIWPKQGKQPTIRDIFGDLPTDVRKSNVFNHNELTQVDFATEVPEALQYAVDNRTTFIRSLHAVSTKDPAIFDRLDERKTRELKRLSHKIETNDLKWDKSAAPLYWDGIAPSMTSLTRLIHPSGTRQVSVREQARLMGYPDDFAFVSTGKLNVIQCLAQGVPAPFVEWVAREIKGALERDGRPVIAARADGHVAVYQNNRAGRMVRLARPDFDTTDRMRIESFPSRLEHIPSEHSMDFV
jgi:DNA (cytosine-5)-methyltransferase 1